MSKIVIVTGSSGGLGGEMAIQFGLTGARVVVNDIAYPDDAERTARKVKESGGDAFVYQADVCNYGQVKAMVGSTLDRWGRIDVLVNNAGGGVRWLGPKGQLVTEMEEEVWDKIVDVNLKGTFFCIKAVAPQMMRQREGHIINVSSSKALRGDKGGSAYAAAKAGILGLTKSVARELGDYNIKVNVVCPGKILHERKAREGMVTAEKRTHELETENLLHQETGSALEFAKFVVHLSQMEDISGQTFNLNNKIAF